MTPLQPPARCGGGGAKQNRGNRTPRTEAQRAALERGAISSPTAAMSRREAGLAIARRYRAEQPFRALLDGIYGAEAKAATADYPFHGHRTCADWLDAPADLAA